MKRKNDVSYHMTWETQDHDFTCSCKNAPIPMASVLHSHDGYKIYLFLSGEIRIIFENDNRIMKRGDLLLIPPYVFHFAVPVGSSTYSCVVINIKESYMQKKRPGLWPFRRLLLSVRFFPVESPASEWNADCPLLRLCPITGSDSSRAFLRLRTRLSGRSPSDNHSCFHRANRWFFLSSRVTPDPASHDHSYLPIHRWSFIGESSSGGYCEAGTSESGVSDPDFQILYRYAHSAIHHWKTDQHPCILLHPEFFRTDIILPVICTKKSCRPKVSSSPINQDLILFSDTFLWSAL